MSRTLEFAAVITYTKVLVRHDEVGESDAVRGPELVSTDQSVPRHEI